jgi:hypothetical protein
MSLVMAGFACAWSMPYPFCLELLDPLRIANHHGHLVENPIQLLLDSIETAGVIRQRALNLPEVAEHEIFRCLRHVVSLIRLGSPQAPARGAASL